MTTTTDYMKPTPDPTADTAPYWDAMREGKLVLQCCADCGKVRHYPRPVCPYCYSMQHRWEEAKGNGTVHSWTVAHHAFHPGFKPELPYTLVTVDLAEGVRMQAQLRGLDSSKLKLGLPVKVAFEVASKDLVLPVFVPA
ncbi:MAG: Zn-ribbon domain-containing OB-fold protein [Proteobacteria bacterium]|nr:Zn-ribbon domain-containing OB-fold protein [Pseudomonadota bacterium]